jgi:aryl-alcohol dehydrogenase-like predicted oxidoreductase
VDALRSVAEEMGRSTAEVALSWVATHSGVSSVLLGASRVEQLAQNISSLDVTLTPEQRASLEQASRPPALNPYSILALPSEMVFGAPDVTGWKAG